MRVYEEYASPQEKRLAQRGAERGVATGKAKGYVLVFNEDGQQNGEYTSAFGELLDCGQGPGAGPESIISCSPSHDYLRIRCRKVGFDTLPEEWKRAFAEKLDWGLDTTPDSEDYSEAKKQRRRYRQILRWA